MHDMSDKNIIRLIEWLKTQGFNDTQIRECLEFITRQ